MFEDFFANCDGIIAANSNVYPYKAVKDAAGDYLISDSVRNYGKATITLTAEKALRLYFSYYGSTTSDEDYPFVVKNGTKDAAGGLRRDNVEDLRDGSCRRR